MKFRIDNSVSPVQGKLTYFKKEFSFNFEPIRNSDFTLLINYLQLQFETRYMQAVQIWGFCPYQEWIKTNLQTPRYIPGALLLDFEVCDGCQRLTKTSEDWDVYYDEKSGWICVGEKDLASNYIAVEFAINVVAVLQNNEIKSIWLKPLFLE